MPPEDIQFMNAGPGSMALANKDYHAAIELFTETLQEDSSNIAAFILLSRTYSKVDQHDYAVGVALHGIQAYIELLETDPDTAAMHDMNTLDELLAESLVLCAQAAADSGYADGLPEQLETGIDYYLANFQLHLSTVVGVQAGLAHKSPMLPPFRFKLRGAERDQDG